MKHTPDWRTNLVVFVLIILFVGGYFLRQTQRASRELQKHSQDHSEILAAVVDVNIRNTLLSQRGLEETVAASLENSAHFIHYLDSIEPFSSVELTAFAAESGLAGVQIVQAESGAAVSGPVDWLAKRECPKSNSLERIPDAPLYLYSFLSGEDNTVASESGCVLVGLSSEKIDATLEKISVEHLLSMFEDLHDIAYVRFIPDTSRVPPGEGTLNPPEGDAVMETIISVGSRQLVVALKLDRFGKRRQQMQKEFIIFISFLILFGAFSSWWLYRVQRQRLWETREFERKMARQHEDAALGRAAATITHELRNPLNAIAIGLQRLQIEAEALDPDHHKLLSSMRNAVDRSDTIITRLKQSIHSFEVSCQAVPMVELIHQGLRLYQLQCDEQQIAVELECKQDVSVSGDKVLLEQLFENLLKNSVEAQPHGGFIKITIKALDLEKECLVEISNGGFKLSREESELLFEPYFTSKSKGTGLGLVICNKIIQAHTGTFVWQADFDKEQILFSIRLPMK